MPRTTEKRTKRLPRTQAKPIATPTALIPRIDLVRDRDYALANSHLFSSYEGFRWFVRHHRTELLEAGAITIIAERGFVDPPKFEQALLRISAERTRKRYGAAGIAAG